jgi:CheY-like chemotaxis protein
VTQGGRILVVDDEVLVRETVGDLLAEEGYTVDLASDGAEAIARVLEHRPDAILLDLMMPGMNGRQFLDAMRGLGHGDVPVVVMTAVQGLAQGGQLADVIEKPFDLDDLLNKVALAVYRSSGHVPSSWSRPGWLPTPPSGELPAHVPAAAAAAERVAPPIVTVPAPTPVPVSERGVILLVDHDRAALQRLDAMLSARGYTVVSMTRVTPQLPRLARALEPRAIILDVEVDPSGTDVVAALRAQPGLADVPILVFAKSPRLEHPSGVEDLVKFVESTPRS